MMDVTGQPEGVNLGPATRELMAEGFVDAINGEDPLGVLLRAHLFVEQDLTAIIEQRVAYPDLLPPRLTFAQKLAIVVAMGAIPEQTLPFYRKLNKLRNDTAHDLGFMMTADHQLDLANLIPPAFKNLNGIRDEFPKGMRNLLGWAAIHMRSARLRGPDTLMRRTPLGGAT